MNVQAKVKAHTNIALIKYWGKRNEQLFLPTNNSISITLDRFYTTTSVTFQEGLTADQFMLDGKEIQGMELQKIKTFLDLIRNKANKQLFAIVESVNNVPTAAGFASSASGYAALAAAASKAIGLNLNEEELSIIARQGSGSALRSVYGGYVEWQKGEKEDGTDSYATQIMPADKWDLSILSVMVEAKEKKVLSREGMKRTVNTSSFYQAWLDTIDEDLIAARQGIKNRDFELLGTVLERNALKMHATTLASNPPFLYWTGATVDVMHEVEALREEGILSYFTIDAGPNVKVICQPKDETIVKERLEQLNCVQQIFVCHPGPGVEYL